MFVNANNSFNRSSYFFNHVIKAEGMNPSEGLFVDDGELNVKMAETLGFKTFKPQNGEDWTGDIKKLLNI